MILPALAERLNSLLRLLDWLFGLAMRAGALFALGLIVYAVIQLFFGADDPAESRSGKLLVLLNGNWKAALLVMLPVFYLPLRALAGRIQEIAAAGIVLKLATRNTPAESDSEQEQSE